MPGVVWTPQEDDRLRKLVDEYGDKRWSLISTKLGSKESKQCRRRWKNCLSLEVKKGSWSPEEDRILQQAHAVHGNRWTLIAKMVGGRTDNAVKNRWAALLRRKSVCRRVRERSSAVKLRGVQKNYGLTPPVKKRPRRPRVVLADSQHAGMLVGVARDPTADALAMETASANAQVLVGTQATVIIGDGNGQSRGSIGISEIGAFEDDGLQDLLLQPTLPQTDGHGNHLSFPLGENGSAEFAVGKQAVGIQVTSPLMELHNEGGMPMASTAIARGGQVGQNDALAQCLTGTNAYHPVDIVNSRLLNTSRMKTLQLSSNIATRGCAAEQGSKGDIQFPYFSHSELDMLITALQIE